MKLRDRSPTSDRSAAALIAGFASLSRSSSESCRSEGTDSDGWIPPRATIDSSRTCGSALAS